MEITIYGYKIERLIILYCNIVFISVYVRSVLNVHIVFVYTPYYMLDCIWKHYLIYWGRKQG
jgi:hypothetical protein